LDRPTQQTSQQVNLLKKMMTCDDDNAELTEIHIRPVKRCQRHMAAVNNVTTLLTAMKSAEMYI